MGTSSSNTNIIFPIKLVSSFVVTNSNPTFLNTHNRNHYSNINNLVNRLRCGSSSSSISSSNNIISENLSHQYSNSTTIINSMNKEEEDKTLNTLVSISDAHDGGNGKLIKITKNEIDEDEDIMINVYINIQKDPYTELEQTYHYQYYNFRSMINIPK